MTKCETCGRQNEGLFEVIKDGVSRTFDSFDCAIEAMARPCKNCGCLITGNDSLDGDITFCCGACQRQFAELGNKLARTTV